MLTYRDQSKEFDLPEWSEHVALRKKVAAQEHRINRLEKQIDKLTPPLADPHPKLIPPFVPNQRHRGKRCQALIL